MIAIISKVQKNLEALKTSCGTMENEFFKLLQHSTNPLPAQRPVLRSNPQAGTTQVTIYGHTLSNYNDASIRSVNAAKNTFIDFVLEDLESRFEEFNDVTVSFDCIFNLLDITSDELFSMSKTISSAYGIPHSDLVLELNLFRTTMEAKSLSFSSFDKMAKYIPTRTFESAFPHLHFLVSVILVLPFVTADCERLFSKLGCIKTTDRNRLGEILNELLLIYNATEKEKESIDIQKTC